MATATRRVAEFVAAFRLDQAPAAVVEKARVTLLHDLGVALAGHRLAGPAFALAAELGRCAPGTGARLPVTGDEVTVESAVPATAALLHARTQDDTQLAALTHLGCTTLPALLALGDRARMTGADLLTAMIAGYEAASAIAVGHAEAATGRGFRATSVFGPFAAAAAVAKLLDLPADRTASALGLAAAFGGGTNQTWVAGTGEWQYQVGTAARNGMMAALLAARGVSGAPGALEGTAGYLRAFTGAARDAERTGAALGREWHTLSVTYKPFPVCAINQVPVSVMVELATAHDLRPSDVLAVTLVLAPHEASYPGTDVQGPINDVGAALMSAPYCIAVGVRERGIGLADLRDFADPELRALAGRVTVVADPGLAGGCCRLTVHTTRGVLTTEFTSTSDTFDWDRHETAGRLRGMAADMPFGVDRLDAFVDVVLDIDRRTVPELVSAMVAKEVR
jgi:2-methylcitrate dehydratase PrpD